MGDGARSKCAEASAWTCALVLLVAVSAPARGQRPGKGQDGPEKTSFRSVEIADTRDRPAASTPRFATFSHRAMATDFEFTLYARPGDSHVAMLERIANEAFGVIDDLERRISSWEGGSEISRINRAAGRGPFKASPDILDFLEDGRRLSEMTWGAFDLTVGPLFKLWGFYDNKGYMPSGVELEEALAKVGMDKVVVDREAGTVSLEREGMALNFGGMGKGMALDRAGEVLRRYGVTSALLHGGTSSVLAIGTPPDADHWTVFVRNPYNESKPIDGFALANASFSTSGCYDLTLEAGGKRYCHIIDPRTGRPVEGVLSVSVMAPTATESDALSTGLLVLGKEGMERFSRTHPEIRMVYVGEAAHDTLHVLRFNMDKERVEE